MNEILKVNNLSVSFDTAYGEVQAVRDVSFSLHEGEVLAIVGESGCGIRKYRLHLALFLQLFYWDAFSANS